MAHQWLPATWSKRVRTALHGRLPAAISKGLRPSHRRSFRSAFYLWHTPTLVDFNHLADLARHRELIPGPARASLFSRRHRLLVDVGKQPLAAASREYVPAARRVAVSRRSVKNDSFPHTNIQALGIPLREVVPVRHRLLIILRASPRGPFMVELFLA